MSCIAVFLSILSMLSKKLYIEVILKAGRCSSMKLFDLIVYKFISGKEKSQKIHVCNFLCTS